MRISLLVLLLLCSFPLFSQEETFRVKPWKQYAGYYEQNKIVISEDGKMIDFPQFLFREKVSEKYLKDFEYSDGQGLFQVVDKEGKSARLDSLKLKSFKELKATLVKLSKLVLIDESKANAEELENLKSQLTAMLLSEGKNLNDYIKSVNNILKGEEPRGGYAEYFPAKLSTLFNDKGGPTEKAMSTLIVKVKKDPTDESELKYNFEILISNPFFELTQSTLNQNWNHYNAFNFAEVCSKEQQLLNDLTMEYEQYKNKDVHCAEEYNIFVSRVQGIASDVKKAKERYVLNIKNHWVLSWLWFSGDLNYDPLLSELPNNYTKSDLKAIEAEIEAYRLMLHAASVNNETDFSKTSKLYAELVLKKEVIEKGLNENEKNEKAKSLKMSKYFREYSTLYAGQFYLSTKSDKHLMRNHDESDGFKQYENQREDYYSFERVHYLSHNHHDSKKVKLTTSGEVISNHQPSWVSDVNEVFSGLGTAYNVDVSDALSTISSFQSKSESLILNTNKSTCATKVNENDLSKLTKDIERLKEHLDSVEIHLRQSVAKSDVYNLIKYYLNAKPKSIVAGKTIEITPESKGYKLSSEVSYNFTTFKNDGTTDKSFAFSKAFKHYKTSYVQLYGGLNTSLTSVDRVVIADEDAEQVDPKIESDPFQFVGGIKIYPWGGVIEDNRFMALNKHRLHFNLGFSIPKPLANIYTGIGYDIIPGWNVNFNAQFYQDKEYIIVDGEVDHSRSIYRPAFAIGTGVDVSVFVNAFKFFLK